jgi:hypothetical protein
MYNQPGKPGGIEQQKRKKKTKPWYLPKTPRPLFPMSCRALVEAGCQLGIKSKETKTSFLIQTLILHRTSFEGSNSEKSKVKRHPCLGRSTHAMIIKQESK